ncbi:RHS domain-containing protein [Streptomyces xanthophaeus]
MPAEFLNVLGVATADDLADYLLSPPPSQPVSCPPPASRGSPVCRPSNWILLALQAAPCRRRHPPGAHRVHLGRGHALRADHARLRPGRTATPPGHAVLGPPGGAPAHPDRASVHCGLPPQEAVDERVFSIVIDLVGSPRELVDESGELAWYTRSTVWGSTAWASSSTA